MTIGRIFNSHCVIQKRKDPLTRGAGAEAKAYMPVQLNSLSSKNISEDLASLEPWIKVNKMRLANHKNFHPLRNFRFENTYSSGFEVYFSSR